MGDVIDITRIRTQQKNFASLLRRLKLRAGDSPAAESVGALLLEVAAYVELHPPWVGAAEHRWIETLTARVAELESRVRELEQSK